jgi:hypothetical protein
VLTVAILVTLVMSGGVAAADPAVPTHYRSQVTAVDPPVEVAQVDVVGGDAFLRIAVAPGHTATVYGYGGGASGEEPYLRIDPDGTVSANRNSPAYWLNNDRYAAVQPPPTATVDALPEWQVVGHGGSYAWHDHRIHWMSPSSPPVVARGAGDEPVKVFDWRVPMAVDAQPVVVRGELMWLPATTPVSAAVVAVVVAAALLVWWRNRAVVLVGLVAASAAGLVVAVGRYFVTPPDARGLPLELLPPAVALTAAVAAGLIARRRPELVAAVGLAAAALLATWSLLGLSALWKPVLPTILPANVDRIAFAVTLAGAVAAVLALLAQQLTSPRPRTPAPA